MNSRRSFVVERCLNPKCRYSLSYANRNGLRPLHPRVCPGCQGTDWQEPDDDPPPKAA